MSTTQSKNPRENQRDAAEVGSNDTNNRRAPRAARGAQGQRDNQQQLGVNPEHKTETMRRRHRGTFP